MKTTIQDVIDCLKEPAREVPADTVDRLLCGDPSAPVTGIAVAFMATAAAIEQTVASGANLLITHEGVYYAHREPAEAPPKTDPVYGAKRELIEKSGLAIYRLHDHVHRYRPDAITAALVEALGWQAGLREFHPYHAIVEVPDTTVEEAARHVKRALNAESVRVVGEPGMRVARIGVLAGYRGGAATALPLFADHAVDLVVYGEGPEWETPAYVRDALQLGLRRALVVLGHEESETPGMRRVTERLRDAFPGIRAENVTSRPLFRTI